MLSINKHLDMLGMRVMDRVTGMEGVVTSVGFDLYGCIQAIVHPGLDKEGKAKDSLWFDVGRLEQTNDVPVMPRPAYEWTPQVVSEGRKGPADRPAVNKA